MSVQSIYKYPLKAPGITEVLMPFGAKVLTAQYQSGELRLWAQCGVGLKPTKRVFEAIGTGWDIEVDGWVYVATVQDGAGYVWHVFEVPQ